VGMQDPPPGYPRVSPYLLYEDAEGAIAYLSEVFEFEIRHRQIGGAGRLHAELLLGSDGLVMLGQAGEGFSSPPRRVDRDRRVSSLRSGSAAVQVARAAGGMSSSRGQLDLRNAQR
jgi:uncharacterized glyoxalase superfamily protein PhnB